LSKFSIKILIARPISKMQLICETIFPPQMSMTITFLTYSSYTSQSIAVVTTATVYLFIARQSRTASKFNRLYLRHF